MITVPELRGVCVEAFETMKRLPAVNGPSTRLGYWPETMFERHTDWKTGSNRVRLHPTSAQISSMDRFFDAVNRLPKEADRKAIFEWGLVKTSRNMTIRGFAEKMGLLEHQYRRKIDEIFQKLAVNYNTDKMLMSSIIVEQSAEMRDTGSPSRNAWDDGLLSKGHWSSKPTKRQLVQLALARSAKRVGRSPDRQRAEG